MGIMARGSRISMRSAILILLALVITSGAAFSDGLVAYPNQTIAMQQKQSAVISHENGYENLLIFVQTSSRVNGPDTNRVWIFPLPAKPSEIEIANLKAFPSMYGTGLKQRLKGNLESLALANFVAAFPPALLFFFVVGEKYASAGNEKSYSDRGPIVSNNGYEIWQHIDKYGIATEVMTTQDSARFYRYLEARGTNLSDDAKLRIEEYIGKDYSFIVSWVSDPAEYRENLWQGTAKGGYYGSTQEPIGVFARFPSEKIFYPLKITSAYKEAYIPMKIDIMGYKEPEIFRNISKETRTEYYFNDRLQYGLDEEESAKKIFNGTIPRQLRFTRISINAQAKYFLQDLEFDDKASVAAITLEILNAIWLPIAGAMFFCISFLAAWLTNKAVLGGMLGKKQICLLALSNFLTIIGFIAAAFVLKTRLGESERPRFRRLYAIPAFWGIFTALAVVFAVISALVVSAII
ncbi:Uncharacterised protein [uncultured archaeon]|nr:Uncharacterised protein [uncultured archaeon]